MTKPGPKPGFKGPTKIRALFTISKEARKRLKILAKRDKKSASQWLEDRINISFEEQK